MGPHGATMGATETPWGPMGVEFILRTHGREYGEKSVNEYRLHTF